MKYSLVIIFTLFLLRIFPIPSFASSHVSVLCYHSFLGRNKVIYDFSITELKSQLLELRRKGFKFVSYREVVNGNIQGDRNILITIDDGNRSVYKTYYEVFKPLGIKPLLAIYPFIIGRKDYSLTWEQLTKLSHDGCSIASHGYFHLKINNKLYNTDIKSFQREIFLSKKTLEKNLNISVDTFIYPFGLCTDVATTAIKKAGYKYAFTIKSNYLKLPLSLNKDMLRLPRFMLTRGNHKYTIKNILRKFGEGQQTIIAQKKSEPIIPPTLKKDSTVASQIKIINNEENAKSSTVPQKHPTTASVSNVKSRNKIFSNDIRGSIDFNRIFDYSNNGHGNKTRYFTDSPHNSVSDNTSTTPNVILESNTTTFDAKTCTKKTVNTGMDERFTLCINNLFQNHGIIKRIAYKDNLSKASPSNSSRENLFQQRWGNLTRNVTSLYTKIIKLKQDRILQFIDRTIPRTASQ